MTKTLTTLIKLSRRQMDDLRHDLNVILDKKEELLAEKRALHDALRQEQETFALMPETQYAYSNFAMNIRIKQENLDRFVAVLEAQAEAMMEKIAEAFQELKRYEILLDIKKKAAEDEGKRRERIEMDEIGQELHRRKEVD